MRSFAEGPGRLTGSFHAYGVVLALILISLAFQLGAPDESWARAVTIALQSVTLLAALRVSGAHPSLLRVATGAAAVAIFASAGILIGSGELGEAGARSVGLLLASVAPVAIAVGLIGEARTEGVTSRTMAGALCVYLLLGMLYGYGYGLVGELSSSQFFAETGAESISDFLYFSFTTMTTTGYGDLTAATDLGRSMAVTEELLGQIYLVSVVAVIASNVGRRRAPADG